MSHPSSTTTTSNSHNIIVADHATHTEDNGSLPTGVVSRELVSFYQGVEIPLAAAVPVDENDDDNSDDGNGPTKRTKQTKKRAASRTTDQSPTCTAESSSISTPATETGAALMVLSDLPSTLDYKDQGRNWSHFLPPVAWRPVPHDLPSTMDYKDQGRNPSEFLAVATPSPTFSASTSCPLTAVPPCPSFTDDEEAAQPIGTLQENSGDGPMSDGPSKANDRRLLYGGVALLLVVVVLLGGVLVAVSGGGNSSSASTAEPIPSSLSPTLAPTPTPVPCVASGSVCHVNGECCSSVCAGPQVVSVDVGVCVTP
jgi:hypothetical protein